MIADNRVGTVLTMSNGMRCTCIEYRNNQDCDFKFEDGAVVENKRWVNFLNGQIAHPNIKTTGFSANEKTLLQILKPYGFINMPKGEIKELHGLELDLYNPNLNGHKVAIEYDGEHWHQNIERDIKKDNLCIKAGIELFRIREGNLPELKTSICIKNNDTTRFSDTFFDATNELINMLNKEYDCNISLVSKEDIYEENITTMFATYQSKIGVTLMMNNGMDCTCIAYRDAKDCDLQFEDGMIVKHKRWDRFKNGNIGYPKEKELTYENAIIEEEIENDDYER